MRYFGRLAFLVALATSTLSPADGWTGMAYADYYFNLQNHDYSRKGQNGFQFRRIYLTYTTPVTDQLTARLRFEGASSGFRERGTNITPFVKDAYLQWSRGDHTLTFGLSSTPTWALVEAHWGYRPVEKSPQDLHQFGSSRDFGISMKGPLGGGGYFVMVGNGAGTSSESNRYKKIYGALNYPLGVKAVVEGYFDYEPGEDGRGKYTILTLQGHGQLQFGSTQIGVVALRQTRSREAGSSHRDLFSVFGRLDLSSQVTAFARADYLPQLNPTAHFIAYTPISPGGKPLVLIAGFDYRATAELHLLPTVELIAYTSDTDIPAPSGDLYVRLTAFVKF